MSGCRIRISFYWCSYLEFISGDTENAVVGFIVGVVLAVVAFVMAREEKETQKFLGFLVENEEKLKDGASLGYEGKQVSLATEVTQFYACVSLLILTTKIPSRFYIRGSHNTAAIGSAYSVISLVLGWWGFPFGPIYTIQLFYKNIRGGEKRPLSQLLSEIEKVAPEQPNSQQGTERESIQSTSSPKNPWS